MLIAPTKQQQQQQQLLANAKCTLTHSELGIRLNSAYEDVVVVVVVCFVECC